MKESAFFPIRSPLIQFIQICVHLRFSVAKKIFEFSVSLQYFFPLFYQSNKLLQNQVKT